MKLTVLKWLGDSSVALLGRLIELIFRTILCFLPLGVYMILLQKRQKASSVNTISVYTNERSKFQHVFPGFILVAVEPNSLNNTFSNWKNKVQEWVKNNKYILTLLFMAAILVLLVGIGG